MAMVVKNNMGATRTLNTLNKNSSALQKSLAKVSSGMKINSAQDDASGYAISERMRVQIRSLDQANQNTQNASSLMKTAEGAVSSTVEILKSLKEKAVNAATDTNTDQDRATIQKELNQFIDQIDDNALTTFNGKYLVDGSKSQSGAAVATALTNLSLGVSDTTGALVTGQTDFTNLTNRNGESLEISSADYVTASFVKNGRTYTTKYRVGKLNGDEASGGADGSTITNLEDLLGRLNAAYTKANAAANGMATANGAPATKPSVQSLLNAISGAATVNNAVVGGTTAQKTNANTANSQAATAWSAAQTLLTNYFNGLDGKTQVNSTSLKDSTAYKNATNTNAQAIATNVIAGIGTTNIAIGAGANVKTATVTANSNVANLLAAYNKQAAAYKNATSGGGGGGGGGVTESGDAFQATVTVGNIVGQNVYGDNVYTGNEETGLTITAANVGINGQISGLTISITDSEGNIKKSANAALDDFNTSIYAKNQSEDNELTFHVGAKANQSITVGLDDMRAEALGLKGSDNTKVSVATQAKANAAIAVFDNAIQKALDQQATIGAIESRLEYTSQNLTTSSENVQAAESTIRDADMAKEMTEYTKNNVLLQAAQSMLAQANQNSSAVLSLLQ